MIGVSSGCEPVVTDPLQLTATEPFAQVQLTFGDRAPGLAEGGTDEAQHL